jgi:succinoglycan biosynthesis protein ExoA
VIHCWPEPSVQPNIVSNPYMKRGSKTQPAGENARSRHAVKASVLVPVFNEEAHIRDTVAGLQAQRIDGATEFLFVDGHSTDRTRRILEELASRDSRIKVLENPRRRVASALNIGLRAAKGEFVVRFDAHTLYPSAYIAAGVARLEQGDVDWVSGAQIAFGTDRWSRRIALALSTRLGIGGAVFRRPTEHEVEVDAGYTGIWRRSTLERLGGWDESWLVNEDGELAARVRAAGGRIVCLPELGARYIPRNSLSALARQYFRYGTYRLKTCRRHPESMRRSHAVPPALALTVLVALPSRQPLARPARMLLRLYVLSVLATSAAVARKADRRDAAALPAVFTTMHLAWGFGFLAGCLRFGAPLRALAYLLAPARRGLPIR